MTDTPFQTLTHDDLAHTTGGAGWVGKGLKFLGKKAGPIGAAWTAYDGVNGYMNARDQGKGVGESLWEGAKSAVW
jgi:hypothetical protein